jgi:hypothetical protein
MKINKKKIGLNESIKTKIKLRRKYKKIQK